MGIRARTRARALVRIEKGGMSQDTPPKERKMKWLFLANSLGIKEKARHFRTRRFHVSSRRKIHPNTPFTNTKSGSDLIENGGAKGIRTPGLYNANVARYQLCYSPISSTEPVPFSQRMVLYQSENKKAIPKNDFLPESCSAAMHIAQKRKSVRHHNLVLFNRTPASNCMTA
jgi:hypothetical protein